LWFDQEKGANPIERVYQKKDWKVRKGENSSGRTPIQAVKIKKKTTKTRKEGLMVVAFVPLLKRRKRGVAGNQSSDGDVNGLKGCGKVLGLFDIGAERAI